MFGICFKYLANKKEISALICSIHLTCVCSGEELNVSSNCLSSYEHTRFNLLFFQISENSNEDKVQ